MVYDRINYICQKLPFRVASAVGALPPPFLGTMTEIRLRLRLPVSVSVGGRNFFLGVSGISGSPEGALRMTEDEMFDTVTALCGGSVYSFEHCIKNGYIPLEGGCRAGLCGHAVTEKNARISSVDSISSICIRIAHDLSGLGSDIMNIFCREGLCGILVFSPPGGGKTTLLRELARTLSTGNGRFSAVRVSVIDERGEFNSGDFGLCDFLSGYPKAEGIELCTRTLSPQVIICDEIGGEAEAEAILAAQNSGVPLLASAHAASEQQLIKRPHIKRLLDNGIFAYTVSLGERHPRRLTGHSVSSV